jgi:hypothetical protein
MGYDHRNRSVGESIGAWRMRPLFLFASAAPLAFGILRIQQNGEFIFRVLMRPAVENLLRFLRASSAVATAAAALNFVVDPLQLLQPGQFYPRCIRTTAACRMPA